MSKLRVPASFALVALVALAAAPAAASDYTYRYGGQAPAWAIARGADTVPGALFYDGPVASAPGMAADTAAPTADECTAALSYFSGSITFVDDLGEVLTGTVDGCAFAVDGDRVRIMATVSGTPERQVAATWRGAADLGDPRSLPIIGAFGVATHDFFMRRIEVPGDGTAPSVRFLAGGDATPLTIPEPGAPLAYAGEDPFTLYMWYPTATGSWVWWLSNSTETALMYELPAMAPPATPAAEHP